jgi:hypothetical protein
MMQSTKVRPGHLRMRWMAVGFSVVALFCGRCWAQSDGENKKNAAWYFAVSGDSRNCGDVVMPAIAEHVRKDGAAFYWHLGDFRAIYDFDDDYRDANPKGTIITYEDQAWPDFIEHQLTPFGDLPVYLAFGNHETIPPKTREGAIRQFADWLDTPQLKAQRLHDDPQDHELKGYYHWIEKGVDFVNLDNASADEFDPDQMAWISAELNRAASNSEIRTLVVGMHEALPDSIGRGHSMNDSAQGTVSGRLIYQQLVDFRKQTHKNVYVLASHSHFFMGNVYNTACRKEHPESILPGWIVGTAGAVRYRLPVDLAGAHDPQTDVYGYLLAAVSPDGSIQFTFQFLSEGDEPAATRKIYSPDLVHACFAGNKASYVPDGPAQPPQCP